MEGRREDHCSRSRYLRPVEPISFSSAEMLIGIFSVLCPSKVSSITQLHGDRKSVVRVTLTSREAADDMDAKMASRKLNINGVLVAEVKDNGFFVKVLLLDVPDYLSSSELESELLPYGPVAYIKREFHEFEGHHLDSEVRHVLYSWLDRELPAIITIDGHAIFITSKYPPSHTKTRAEKDTTAAVGNTKEYRHVKSTRSRAGSPVRPTHDTSVILSDKPPSAPALSSTSGLRPTPEPETMPDKMADAPRFVEIISSPHGTLPRKIYRKVSEVVETPVEEVTRNLSPYMERHQLRLLDATPGETNESDPDVGHRKLSLRSPDVPRRRSETLRDEPGNNNSIKTSA